jgi:hypothetical protein
MNQPPTMAARPLFVIGDLSVKVKWEDAKIDLLFAKKRFPASTPPSCANTIAVPRSSIVR